jgi:SAM-dependent methyltransferase
VVASKEDRALSFGAIAEDYDRLRPTPPADSLDWIVPAPCGVAVDVAAGTGLLTRALIGRAGHVIAVEPDDRMRAVLADKSPEVEALRGTGEQIPLPDASADALFVSSAWHWLDPDRAIPEIARVLRDGGRFGVLWTSRDRDIDWVRDLDKFPATLPTDPVWDAEAEREHRRKRAVGLSGAEPFANVATQSFGFTRRMEVNDVVEMVASYSAVITAPEAERRALLDLTRGKLEARFAGQSEIDVPMRTWCWRADRLAR